MEDSRRLFQRGQPTGPAQGRLRFGDWRRRRSRPDFLPEQAQRRAHEVVWAAGALAQTRRAMSAGWKISADTSVHTSDIISSLPMLAVPGSFDAQRLPKPVAVARALKNT